jgi:acyl-CoA synthetase (AMP-forming)/AMP-acid ligase II
MENCGEFFECLYGCWAAGLVAVPCNAKLHPREIEHVVSDCGATLILTTPGLASGAQQALSGTEIICTGTAAYERLIQGESVAAYGSRPEDLAWLFYTSGTTGRPKGAMLSHQALLAMSPTYLADVDFLGPSDIKLHMAPLSHASGLYSLPFFLKGAQHIVLPGFDLEALADVLSRHRNVTMFAAPTMLTRLVNSPIAHEIDSTRIRTIYYGGGPMYVADLERALRIFGPRLYQIFGQGESPMTITGLDQAGHLGSNGQPFTERLAVVSEEVVHRV